VTAVMVVQFLCRDPQATAAQSGPAIDAAK
jgi:hypothetical protein